LKDTSKLSKLSITINYNVEQNSIIKSKKFDVKVSEWIKLSPEQQTQKVAKKCGKSKLITWSI
jgi:hypothetical protein